MTINDSYIVPQANPEDTSRLKLDYEFNSIDEMVQMTPYKDSFDLVSRHGMLDSSRPD